MLEFAEFEFIKQNKLVNSDSVVFDIGAHVGEYSQAFAPLVKHVYAFEPCKEFFRVNDPKVTFINCAVSDKSGSGKLYIGSSNPQDSRIYADKLEPNRNSLPIEIITIDEFVEKQDIKQLDFIKIDTQGYDFNVVRGGVNTIRKFKPAIFTEFWPYGLDAAGCSPGDFLSWMMNLGYIHTAIDNVFSRQDGGPVPQTIEYLLSHSPTRNDWYINLIWRQKS